MYRLDKDNSIKFRRMLNKYEETLKTFGAFVVASSFTGVLYGIIRHISLSVPADKLKFEDCDSTALVISLFISVYLAHKTYENYKIEKKRKISFLDEYHNSKKLPNGFKTEQDLANERFVRDAYKNDKVVPIRPFLNDDESSEIGYSKVFTRNGSGNNNSDDGFQK